MTDQTIRILRQSSPLCYGFDLEYQTVVGNIVNVVFSHLEYGYSQDCGL
jgi:hypothetical protein